jgi:hypothetical protein
VWKLWLPFDRDRLADIPLRIDGEHGKHTFRQGQITITDRSWTAVALARYQDLRNATVVLDSVRVAGEKREELARLIESIVGLPGTSELSKALDLTDTRSESPLESAARVGFALLGLPAPLPQFPVVAGNRSFRVDFAWPDQRLVVEVDGESKYSPEEYRRERWRQREIESAGWTVLRLVWADIRDLQSPAMCRVRAAAIN